MCCRTHLSLDPPQFKSSVATRGCGSIIGQCSFKMSKEGFSSNLRLSPLTLNIHWLQTWILRDTVLTACQVSRLWGLLFCWNGFHGLPSKLTVFPKRVPWGRLSSKFTRSDTWSTRDQLCIPRAGDWGVACHEINTVLSLRNGDCL